MKYTSQISRITCLKRSVHVARNVLDMREYHKLQTKRGVERVGFVPTMGALHSGHLELMKLAKKSNDIAVASVFVNPTQFSAGEDYEKYPRQLDQDLEMMKIVGIDCVFAPETAEMYPLRRLCHVEPSSFSQIYEGQARPEFFRGVATIVCKLFNIVQPTTAYFGQKDVSQCILIRRMVQDLNIPVHIHIVETIRDADGLALSSRNAYLTPDEKKKANILYRSLLAGKTMIEESQSSVSAVKVKQRIEEVLKSEPLVTKIEYISIASHEDMKELGTISMNDTGAVISSAIRLGNVRLIDNLLVGRSNELLSSSEEQ
jgi:pantoate--beta-alanine ligase